MRAVGNVRSPLAMEIEYLDIFGSVGDQRGVVGALRATSVGRDFDLEGTAVDIAIMDEHLDDGTNLGDLRDPLIDPPMSGDATIRPEQAAAIILSTATGHNSLSDVAVDSWDELQDGGRRGVDVDFVADGCEQIRQTNFVSESLRLGKCTCALLE